jgi:hypothetical protein
LCVVVAPCVRTHRTHSDIACSAKTWVAEVGERWNWKWDGLDVAQHP